MNCFLCRPDPRLMVQRGASSFWMTGLGPIVPNYSLIASYTHSRSYADVYAASTCVAEELVDIRVRIEGHLGPILLTEHGRVPVCRREADQHEQHCYHAHILVFPGAPSILSLASSYYRKCQSFPSLQEALAFAGDTDSYMLISPTQSQYNILHEPLNIPRQLARFLVAHQIGEADKADWRQLPNYAETISAATSLRRMLGGANVSA